MSDMNLVFPLFLILIIGITIPAYAQNVSDDEDDIKIRELIKECQDKVKNDESSTDAEKTVAQRECETDITNEYNNVEIDYKNQDEKRMKLQNMQSCVDWHPQYRYLTENQFRMQKHSETVNDCILLYHDSIWDYVGDDRLDKLSERLDEIRTGLPQEPETREVTLDVNIPQLEPKIITESNIDEVSLKEKVRLLEEQIAQKDEIIKEQINVIMDLANRIKKIMFEPFDSFFMQFRF
jgi:hypothetical protein